MKRLRDETKIRTGGGLQPGQSLPSSDAELVRAAWRGDKQAFVEIVARHQAMVCGTALGIVGNLAASEDAGQEAFLMAWCKIHELREPERLRAWLRQIARHVALGYQRRHRGHDALEEAPELADAAPAPDEQAASEEEAALVRRALSQLPELYREPLILFYRENQSTKAVSAALDISEEAVRQRLARGREMLREQVSGVIETVLARTGPTAIFTMTVAVAIGALATPAVVAGGVFTAAASAAAGKAATTTPATLLNTISASKGFLLAVVLATVVGIPVGYRVRTGDESRADAAASAANESAPETLPKARPSFETSAIFAEWKRLHDIHGTTIEAMPNIYREIGRFNDSFRRRGFRAALMAEWVQLDPTNGMASFRERTIDASQRRQFVDEWLDRDAAAAMDALLGGGRAWESIVRDSLPGLAQRAPERVARVVAKLQAESPLDSSVREAFALVAERDVDSARAAAEAMPGPNRGQALAGVAQTWGSRDLDGALAWARKLSHAAERDEVLRAALVGMASANPVFALERVSSVAPGGKKGYFASTTGARVLKEAARVDFDATVGWLAEHPRRLGHDDLMGLTSAVSEKLNTDAAGFLSQYAGAGSLSAMLPAVTNVLANESSGQQGIVWEWLQKQPEDAVTRELRRAVLSTAGRLNMAMAFRLANESPQTSEGNEQLGLLADGLLHHGRLLHRLDGLLEQAPERLRPALVESAFQNLRSANLADPQRWLDRLSQLPEGMRARGMESVARAWAGQAPYDAIHWIASMPAGDARALAVAGIASVWAAKDSPAASSWVATMPAGAERDRSAQSLVLAMAEQFPREAWDWAMSIDDAEGRTRAAIHAARMMAARDSATARDWIENGPLTLGAKATIRSAVEKESESLNSP